MTALLTFAYVAVAALLLNLGVRSRWPLAVKVAAVVTVSALYAGTYVGYRSLEGWPTRESPPDLFRLHAVIIEEPDRSLGLEGAIYYWVRQLDESGEPSGPPRSYRRSFSPLEMAAARKALELLEGGEPVEGLMALELEDSEGARSSAAPSDQRSERPEFEFREVAPPTLPPKLDP